MLCLVCSSFRYSTTGAGAVGRSLKSQVLFLTRETAPAHLCISKNRFLSSAVWCGFSYFFFFETAASAELRQTRHRNPTFGPSAYFFCQFLVSLPALTRSTSGQKIMALSFCEAQAGFTETESLSGRLNNTTHARQPCKNTKRILFFTSQYITPPTRPRSLR